MQNKWFAVALGTIFLGALLVITRQSHRLVEDADLKHDGVTRSNKISAGSIDNRLSDTAGRDRDSIVAPTGYYRSTREDYSYKQPDNSEVLGEQTDVSTVASEGDLGEEPDRALEVSETYPDGQPSISTVASEDQLDDQLPNTEVYPGEQTDVSTVASEDDLGEEPDRTLEVSETYPDGQPSISTVASEDDLGEEPDRALEVSETHLDGQPSISTVASEDQLDDQLAHTEVYPGEQTDISTVTSEEEGQHIRH